MGRTYMVNANVQMTFNKIIESSGNDWSVGLVIGQHADQKDYVVHVAATPKFEPPAMVETEEEDEPIGGKTSTVKTMKGSESRNSLCLGKTLDTLNEKQVTNHARQAQRMLTGGLDILGVFVVAAPDDMKNAQPKLRQVVYSVQKFLSRSEQRLSTAVHNDRVLLHLCPLTNKYTCRTFDVSDSKASGSPAEWKVLKTPESFTELTTNSYSLDTTIPIDNEALSFNLQKQIISGLSGLFEGVSRGLPVLRGQLITEQSVALSSGSEQSKSKNKKQTNENSDVVCIDLLQTTYGSGSIQKPALLSCGAKMVVRGTVATKAFVNSRSTVAEAVKALKCDIIRSITSRCELLCEDLLSAEEDQDASVLYETPTRVFVTLPGSTVQFCDYLFQDESLVNCVERFRELLSVDVNEGDIDASLERIPDEEDLSFTQLHRVVDVAIVSQGQGSSGHVTHGANKSVNLYTYVSVLLALLAVLVAYLFLSHSS